MIDKPKRLGLVALILFLQGFAGVSHSYAQACDGSCTTAQSFLTENEVSRVISQAVQEAQALNVLATIAVVDRVGNVLGVYRMGDPLSHEVLIATETGADNRAIITGGLEGLRLPTASVGFVIDDQVAITKAITGAYLSSEGNAFSTRTASQIIQENFNYILD